MARVHLHFAESLIFIPHRKGQTIMWYIVLSRSKPEMEGDKQAHYDEHRLWLENQHKAGRLLFSGPTTDGAYGIYIMLASSLDDKRDRRPGFASPARHPHDGSARMEPAPRLPDGQAHDRRCRTDST